MIQDKNGDELKVGDEIVFRARIEEVPMMLEEDGLALLRVKWYSEEAPMLDYIRSNQVEKSS